MIKKSEHYGGSLEYQIINVGDSILLLNENGFDTFSFETNLKNIDGSQVYSVYPRGLESLKEKKEFQENYPFSLGNPLPVAYLEQDGTLNLICRDLKFKKGNLALGYHEKIQKLLKLDRE